MDAHAEYDPSIEPLPPAATRPRDPYSLSLTAADCSDLLASVALPGGPIPAQVGTITTSEQSALRRSSGVGRSSEPAACPSGIRPGSRRTERPPGTFCNAGEPAVADSTAHRDPRRYRTRGSGRWSEATTNVRAFAFYQRVAKWTCGAWSGTKWTFPDGSSRASPLSTAPAFRAPRGRVRARRQPTVTRDAAAAARTWRPRVLFGVGGRWRGSSGLAATCSQQLFQDAASARLADSLDDRRWTSTPRSEAKVRLR